MRSVRAAHLMLCGLLLAPAHGVLSQAAPTHVQNIVLVHGAWVDGSGWNGVYEILARDGYKVTVVQLPLTSFKDDVAATKRILALQNGPAATANFTSVITKPAWRTKPSAMLVATRDRVINPDLERWYAARGRVSWSRSRARAIRCMSPGQRRSQR